MAEQHRESHHLTVRAQRHSVRVFLICLVIACLTPGIMGSLALIAHEYRSDRAQFEADILLTTRALVKTVDGELHNAQILAQALSSDPALKERDFARFARRARETLAIAGAGFQSVLLRDATGQQLVNTQAEPDTPLPKMPAPKHFQRVIDTGRPVVSDLFLGRVSQIQMVSVSVPVIEDGKVAYVLSVGIRAEYLGALLRNQGLPTSWAAAIFDTQGTIVAHTRDGNRLIGQPGMADYVAQVQEVHEGVKETVIRDGTPVLAIYSRSPVTNWTVNIGIPLKELISRLTGSLAVLAAGVTALFAIGLGLAWYMARQFSRSVKALAEPAGDPEATGTTASGFQISEIAEAAELLQARTRSLLVKEEELAKAHRLARFGNWYWDCRTGEVIISDSLREIYGGDIPSFPEQRGTTMTVESWERLNAAAQEALRTGIGYDLELQVFHADGTPIWINAKSEVIRDEEGESVGLRGTVQDITESRKARDALRRSEIRFRATFEQAAVGIAHVGLDGRFLQVNDRLCTIVGYEREEMLNLTVQDLTYPPDLLADVHLAQQLLTGIRPSYSLEKRYLRPGGTTIWANLTVSLVRTSVGKPDYFLSVIEDVQRRKETEAALASNQRLLAERSAILQITNRDLEAANQQLEGFLYAASHDLKGPLARISNFSALLERDYGSRLEGDGTRFLHFIKDNALRLTHLIDDLLNHARIDRQASELEPIDINCAVRVSVHERTEDIIDRGAEVLVELPPVRVLANSHALHQVLHNLLENSLKYATSVTRPVLEIGGETVGKRFRLWVRDNGIGFDMKYHDRIFEIFRRLHTYAEYTGSGVGLALVKRAMERMGGKVWAESQLGEGSTFYLEFDMVPQGEDQTAPSETDFLPSSIA